MKGKNVTNRRITSKLFLAITLKPSFKKIVGRGGEGVREGGREKAREKPISLMNINTRYSVNCLQIKHIY